MRSMSVGTLLRLTGLLMIAIVNSISLNSIKPNFNPFSIYPLLYSNQASFTSTTDSSFTVIPTRPTSAVTQTLPSSWKESIQPSRALSYMPMLKNQLELMKSHDMETVTTNSKFAYKESDVKKARISSMTFKNSVFRKIRLTYFDGGDNVQVFNSVWYPNYKYDIPILGMDLISLGKSRVLNVIDLQPLHPSTDYSDKYIDPLSSIRSKYSDLHHTLSGKIYDDTSFFSKNMLFGRFTDESKLDSVVAPAANEYLKYYLNLSKIAVADETEASMKVVYERQKEYDVYNAIKDPAVGLFDAYFGKEWSSSFVHDYLFEHSSNSEANYVPPTHKFEIPSS